MGRRVNERCLGGIRIISILQINQNKLEILRKGNKGKAIVFLTGMGCSFDEWYNITQTLGETNRIVMFHRPGLGKSEIGNEVRNTEAVVKELNDLLSVLEITEPIILVGHSYGGLCVQHFIKVYPKKVAGIVLVDSTSVDLEELDTLNLPVLDEEDRIWLEKCKTYASMRSEQLRKNLNPILSKKLNLVPKEIKKRLLDFQVSPSLYKAMYSEISNWKQDAKIIKSLGTTLNVPIIVIGRDNEFCIKLEAQSGLPEEELRIFEGKWKELIIRQGKLTSNSNIVFAQSSSHSIHMDRPDIIIQSVFDILDKCN